VVLSAFIRENAWQALIGAETRLPLPSARFLKSSTRSRPKLTLCVSLETPIVTCRPFIPLGDPADIHNNFAEFEGFKGLCRVSRLNIRDDPKFGRKIACNKSNSW
jgi:hypothetical protein